MNCRTCETCGRELGSTEHRYDDSLGNGYNSECVHNEIKLAISEFELAFSSDLPLISYGLALRDIATRYSVSLQELEETVDQIRSGMSPLYDFGRSSTYRYKLTEDNVLAHAARDATGDAARVVVGEASDLPWSELGEAVIAGLRDWLAAGVNDSPADYLLWRSIGDPALIRQYARFTHWEMRGDPVDVVVSGLKVMKARR